MDSTNHGYTRRFPHLRYRTFEQRGASTLGLGACRERGEDDPRAVVSAISLGCNVLDTAPHYRVGGHERCVGSAVRIAISDGVCDRDSLIITTKVGLIPDLIENNIRTHGFGRMKALVEERFVVPGIFTWHDLANGVHTIAPSYIRHSINQSLSRMGLENVDCLFLESPDVQLSAVNQREYHRRLFAAFETLEALCASGKVRSYGISTDAPIDLDELVQIAKSAAGSTPRLRALTVPFSLLRQDFRPMIDKAGDLGLYVFASGCLDGGTPGYQLPDELDAHLGSLCDSAAAIRWVQSAPNIGTALVGSRDARHIRNNLAAAALSPLSPALYGAREGAPA
jgi:aryl-alcohol dehydrogenase-like predicted oxidoreductase